MKKCLIALLFFLSFGITAYGLDFPDIKGFSPESEVNTYNSTNLYEYINGAADAYLAYGFQLLLSRDLAFGDIKFAADIYDMGSRLNALGIYKSERPTDVAPIQVGVQSVVSPPYQALLLKDAYYVKINAYEGELTLELGKSILEKIAAALPGSEELPEVFDQLPLINRVPGSESYVHESFLGLSGLNRCIFASYEADEATYRHFLILTDQAQSTDDVWKSLAAEWTSLGTEKQPLLFKKIPYKGYVGVQMMDGQILGVADCQTKQQMMKALKAGSEL